jgi:predicted dehydrogenase
LEIYSNRKKSVDKRAQDKGHDAQIKLFLDAIVGEADPPDVATYLNSTRAALALIESLRTGETVYLELR